MLPDLHRTKGNFDLDYCATFCTISRIPLLNKPETLHKRRYRTLRIPRAVY
jgi:hypothetical protein